MDEYRVRVRIFTAIIVAVLCILGLRLAQMQLLDNQLYMGESRSNSVRELRVQPARGAIYDHDGRLMIDNVATYAITITPRYFDNEKIPLLAHLLDVPVDTVKARLKAAKDWSPFRPSRVFRELPFATFSRVLENQYELPGVGYEVEQKRRYVTSARAAHAMGYIREISDGQLLRHKDEGYRQGDMIGQTGIELNYEAYLRGQMGSEFKLVNIHGRELTAYQSGKEDTPPISGYNLYTTLDSRVQALAESLFVGKRGGAVAIDPNTGGIIALLSYPDFDPQVFTQSVDAKTWQYLTKSAEKPLLNRATMNLMPPGSTWKPFMALMSLQEGNIKPGEKVVCRGGHPLGGGVRFKCMEVHGALDVQSAIRHSCNTFFFEMMNRTDVNTYSRYAHMFGFGERAPMEINEQTSGLIPDSAYFNRFAGKGVWGIGWTLSLGIGQGNMGVTPLQLARYVAAVANKGTLQTPHLVDRLVNPETGEVVRPALPAPRHVPIKPEYFDLVRQGMRLVMEQGTGRGVQIPGIPSGGKTGTAQAGNRGKDDSVFIMFAPWDKPRIAIAVQVENAGFGAQAAAPIASLLAEMYLTGKIAKTPERQAVLQRALNARSAPLPQRKANPS